MNNIGILTKKLTAEALPISGMDSDGNLSWFTLPKPDQVAAAAAIIAAFDDAAYDYLNQRAEKYPALGDQLDAITKALSYMASKGVDIGPDGVAQVAAIQSVKDAFPKPAKT